jgi:hypothetical protein
LSELIYLATRLSQRNIRITACIACGFEHRRNRYESGSAPHDGEEVNLKYLAATPRRTAMWTQEQFEQWASEPRPDGSPRSIGEIEAKARDLQNELTGELLATSGNTLEEFAAAPRDGKQMMLEAGGQIWLDEQAERDAEEAERQAEAQASENRQTQIMNNFRRQERERNEELGSGSSKRISSPP